MLRSSLVYDGPFPTRRHNTRCYIVLVFVNYVKVADLVVDAVGVTVGSCCRPVKSPSTMKSEVHPR